MEHRGRRRVRRKPRFTSAAAADAIRLSRRIGEFLRDARLLVRRSTRGNRAFALGQRHSLGVGRDVILTGISARVRTGAVSDWRRRAMSPRGPRRRLRAGVPTVDRGAGVGVRRRDIDRCHTGTRAIVRTVRGRRPSRRLCVVCVVCVCDSIRRIRRRIRQRILVALPAQHRVHDVDVRRVVRVGSIAASWGKKDKGEARVRRRRRRRREKGFVRGALCLF